jgi:predicted transcriptional regulator
LKHKIRKQDVQNLASGIVAAVGIAGYIFLIVLALRGLIVFWDFLFWMAVVTVIMVLDSCYIENHFIDGEWV